MALTARGQQITREADRKLAELGVRINELSGYKEIERLKDLVSTKETDLIFLRDAARQAKLLYDNAVAARATAQRDVNLLLERKHSWTDADVSSFTDLVRADHSSNLAVTSTASRLAAAEATVDKAFSDLMQSILRRYHEEQIWSDKIRSVSTWTNHVGLLINFIIFIGAIAIVEPWKRRKLVERLEQRTESMMAGVHTQVEALANQVGSLEHVLINGLQRSASRPSMPESPAETSEPASLPARRIDQTRPLERLDWLISPLRRHDLLSPSVCGFAVGAIFVMAVRWSFGKP